MQCMPILFISPQACDGSCGLPFGPAHRSSDSEEAKSVLQNQLCTLACAVEHFDCAKMLIWPTWKPKQVAVILT